MISRPSRRPELLPGRQRSQRYALPVTRLREYCVTPPCLDGILADRPVLRILQAEEDNNHGDGNARVERGGKHVVVLRPPAEVPSPDDILEGEPDDGPWYVVDRSGRRDCEVRTIAINKQTESREYEVHALKPVPVKMTGKFTYLMNEFGHFSEMRYATSGATAPMRKKYNSA